MAFEDPAESASAQYVTFEEERIEAEHEGEPAAAEMIATDRLITELALNKVRDN